MGLLIAVGNTTPKFPYDYYYGIEWDYNVSNSACTRIGRPELHVSLPIQSGMRRCLLKDDGTVNYYLHATDSTKRDNGAAANLDGTDGQVMVEIPAHFRKFEVEGTKYRCYLSEFELPGFHYVPKAYRSAYEAVVDRTVSATPKLCSVVNTSASFRGGNNTTAWDGTYRSLLGRPSTSITLANFRTYARNRGNGTKWNCDVYEVQKTCYWLYAVEYANFNCQLAFNAQPTSEGYKQGGLSSGVTTLANADMTTLNSRNPFVPCGYTNSLGNNTGVISFTMPTEYPGTVKTVDVPSYRGLENPFGHIWKHVDGVKIRVQSEAAGGLSELYICRNPANFQSTDYTNYELCGYLPRANGYIKRLIMGEYGENMPAEIGGASTTYFADYHWTTIPDTGESQRCVLFSGYADNGANTGIGCADTYNAVTYSGTLIGSRLCFIPE